MREREALYSTSHNAPRRGGEREQRQVEKTSETAAAATTTSEVIKLQRGGGNAILYKLRERARVEIEREQR